MSFTDQKPHIVTEEDCKARWSFKPNGEMFYCNLCGAHFHPGDVFRWVYANGLTVIDRKGKKWGCCNLFVCGVCDGGNDYVLNKWKAINELYHEICYLMKIDT